MTKTTLRTGAAFAAVTGIALLAGCSATVGGATESQAPEATDSATPQSTPSTTAATDGTASGTYTDGSYTASGTYLDGAQTVEELSVTVTLAGDAVTEVTVTGNPQNDESIEYQEMFIDGISDAVVGKSLDELLTNKVTQVGGSSLTSGGFNEALDQIAADAKA